jgi:hypothetical protein
VLIVNIFLPAPIPTSEPSEDKDSLLQAFVDEDVEDEIEDLKWNEHLQKWESRSESE